MGGSPFFTFRNYLTYRTSAVGAHALHSPFVYKLFTEIIKKAPGFRIAEIEQYRKSLFNNNMVIDVIDFKTNSSQRKTIGSVARSSLSKPKFSAFLHLLLNELQTDTVLETGTSLGVNALYMAHASSRKVVTMEASPILSELARKEFENYSLDTLKLEFGNIHETFIPALEQHKPDFIFLDADHRGSVIKEQVEQILNHTKAECIVIHDIYWSEDMHLAWQTLVKDDRFMLTVDIFQAGILFPSKGIEKQHFTLRF